MQSWLKIILYALLLSTLSLAGHAKELKVMTFNLRVPIDPYPNDWNSRLPRVIAIIKHQQPDFLGVQETTPEMLGDLRRELPEYLIIGRGRNTDEGGEGTQIFYKKNRWNIDRYDHGTLQLSPTPNIPGSNGWNMQWPRIFTWVHLKEKRTQKSIYIYNTHFPLRPQERDLSARQISSNIAERKHKRSPVILTGDFNACESEDSMRYLLGEHGSPIAMKDTFRVIQPNNRAGTFHAFGKTESCKIDYIYVLGKIRVLDANLINEQEPFASDHLAVTATLQF